MAAARGSPAVSCASACRHQAYPAGWGQPIPSQVFAAALHASGSFAPASRVRSASQVARSAGIVATSGWSLNGYLPSCPSTRPVRRLPRVRLRGRCGAPGLSRLDPRRRAFRSPAAARRRSSCPRPRTVRAPAWLPGGHPQAGPPQGQLRRPLPGFPGEVNDPGTADEYVDLLLPTVGRTDVAAQQVDLSAPLVHDPVTAIWRPGGQRVNQCRCLGCAPPGEQCLGCVDGQNRGR